VNDKISSYKLRIIYVIPSVRCTKLCSGCLCKISAGLLLLIHLAKEQVLINVLPRITDIRLHLSELFEWA